MNQQKRIVVLGAGYAGVEAAKSLHHKLRKRFDIHITIIDRNPYHTLMTELHEIAGSRTGLEAVQISLAKIFSDHGVEVAVDTIETIDFDARILKSARVNYPYDYLVIATGGSPEFFGTPGVQENAFTLWSLEDAIRIRENVELRFRDAAKEPDPIARKRLLTFAIAGAGFTGIELAGELLDRAELLCPQYHIDQSEVKVMVIEAKDSVLPILTKSLQIKASRYLAKRKAEVLVNAPITKAEEGKIFLADGRVIEAATFIWTCGIQGSDFTSKIDLEKGRVSNDRCSIASPQGIHGMAGCHFDDDEQSIVGERGRILVNDFLQSPKYPEVFLCGDMIWYVYKEKVVPQIVETAIQSGKTVARNIVAAMEKRNMEAFQPEYHGFMVSIGAKYGVAEIMGMRLSGFFAMGFKHLINLHYLFMVAGFNVCWAYFQHEFANVNDRRSITRGHLSAKIPAYWALPARLWLGAVWCIEALNKIGEGWLDFARGSKTAWMFSEGVVQAGVVKNLSSDAAGSDVTSAASEVIAEGTDAVVQAVQTWKIDLATPVIPPDSWIATTFKQLIMDTMAPIVSYQLLQTMIVSVELGIGLALFGGFLTWGAALVSMAMCAVFTISGMFNWDQLWFIFLAIVLLGGAGHAGGLDHWVMPWAKKFWNSTILARRTRLYDGEPIFKRKKSKE